MVPHGSGGDVSGVRSRTNEFVGMIGMPMPAQVATIPPRRVPRVRSGSIGSSPRETPADSARRPRILVVDDLHDSADSLAAVLAVLGYGVRVAYDGAGALAAAAEWRPDIAVLDIAMPRMDGYELARRLQEETWGEDILLIAVTGWADAEHRRRAIEIGFDHHFAKPVAPAALLAAIAAAPIREITRPIASPSMA